jgi:TRAP-type transport system periplasmic protein
MKISKKLYLVAGLLLLGLCFYGKASAADVIEMKLGGINPPTVPMTMAHLKFAELIKQKSNGRIVVNVYPASQLGDATSQIAQVMSGGIDMFGAADSFYAQYVNDFRVLAAPYLFENEAQVKKFLGSPYYTEITNQLISKMGVREIVGGLIRPPEVLEATKPIRKLGDFKGIMMRVPEIEIYKLFAEALGANIVKVAWGEMYMALSQGVCQALIPPLDAIYPNKLHLVAPYILLTRHNWSRGTIIINEKRFQTLSPSDQKLLFDAAKETNDWFLTISQTEVSQQIEKMKSQGAVFYEVEDPNEFKGAMQKFVSDLDAKGYWRKGLYNDIRAYVK